MKNAKALLELGACGVGEPFWLGLGKSGLRAAEPPREHRWFPFGRLSKELPPLAAWVSPLPRRTVFVCLGKDEPHYLSCMALGL